MTSLLNIFSLNILGFYFTKINFESTTTKYYLKMCSFLVLNLFKYRNENSYTQNFETLFV